MSRTTDTRLASRARVLAGFGASAAVTAELLAYDAGDLSDAALPAAARFPLEDEPFVEVWREYSQETAAAGIGALATRFPQLCFPIQEGISQSEEYRAATRRGAPTEGMRSATGLVLARPRECIVTVHPTWAGSIPVVTAGCRDDFVSLLRAFTARNEPVPVPASQGASIISGYNNWDRVRRWQNGWSRANPGAAFSLDLLADLEDQYQDRFILISRGWYSNVPPGNLGVTAEDWQHLSLTIRREHECAHYWTRRVLSLMRNRLWDEVIADSCGIVAACGRLRADWLVAVLGVRSTDGTGRWHNYRGSPPLSDAAFELLRQLTLAAIENLDAFARRHADVLSGERGLLLLLLTLSRLALEDVAWSDAQIRLADALRRGRALAAETAVADIRFLPQASWG